MRNHWRRVATLTIAAGVLLPAVWAFWWEPRRLVVRQESAGLACWTAGPVRIGVASDLHVGAPGMDLSKLERLVDASNLNKPDVVVLLGDFVIQGVKGGRFVSPETIAQTLRRLTAPLGVYAVLGNHDWWLDGPRVERAIRDAGIPVIDDRAVRVGADRNAFWIAGISDFWEGKHDIRAALAAVSDEAPVLAITHNPDVFPLVPDRVCLTLAGHTHGGQVAVPLLGRPVVPSMYGQRYAAGHVHEEGRHLFVTSGVGTSIMPVRFRVPPELVLLHVQNGAPSQ